jgi:N-methylhydantoinase A
MARAVRRVSMERGHDPADFTLVAFGGAGPLHACEVAEAVGARRVLVPRFPGVLSALGMALAPVAVERSVGLMLVLEAAVGGLLAERAATLEREARAALTAAAGGDAAAAGGSAAQAATAPADAVTLRWFADARYLGQSHELRVEVAAPVAGDVCEAFHDLHERTYGYAARERTVELVALRCRAEGAATAEAQAASGARDRGRQAGPGVAGEVRSSGGDGDVVGAAPTRPPEPRGALQLWSTIETWPLDGAAPEATRLAQRDALRPGARIAGPAVVIQDDATTWVPAGWRGVVDGDLNLVLEGPG